jgi:molybdopterin-guanine dinucleotide biosynthesis protein A
MRAAILAGGRGRRMGGVPKALIEVEGRRIVDRQLDVLVPLFDEVLLVVASAEGWDVPRARQIVDAHPGLGPLAGLEAALAEGDAFVVGCDLPFLDEKLIRAVLQQSAQAVVPRVDDRAQPLHAFYAHSCLPAVKARLAQQKLRLLELLDDLEVRYLDVPPQRGLTNVNAPGDLTA